MCCACLDRVIALVQTHRCSLLIPVDVGKRFYIMNLYVFARDVRFVSVLVEKHMQ